MKININTELDMSDEDFQEMIIKDISDNLYGQMSLKIKKRIRSTLANKLNDNLDQFILDTLAEFMDRKIRITDKYGTIQHEYENVDEMLKEKFDNYILEKVDGKGKKTDTCSYRGDNLSRIEWMIDNKIQKEVDVSITEAFKKIESHIKYYMREKFNKEANERIAKSIVSQVDVSKLLE